MINHKKLIKKYITKKIPIVKENYTIKRVLSILEKESTHYDSTDYVYVTDEKKHLIGVFAIKELFNRSKDIAVGKFMQTNIITVSPDAELEQIAHLALKHDLKAIPIVKSKKLVGIIPSRKILYILNKALREDIFHFAGVHKSHLEFESSLEIPLFKVIKDRLFWLIVGLFGAMFIAFYMGFFEETLAKHILIASFVPAIIYMSDALGTQLQTVFIRDLAVIGKQINLKKYLFRQFISSFFIAIIISTIMFFLISLLWKESFIAFVISTATLSTLIITSITALLITISIKKFKFDPALGSGPIATIISDVSSVIIYFFIVIMLL